MFTFKKQKRVHKHNFLLNRVFFQKYILQCNKEKILKVTKAIKIWIILVRKNLISWIFNQANQSVLHFNTKKKKKIKKWKKRGFEITTAIIWKHVEVLKSSKYSDRNKWYTKQV